MSNIKDKAFADYLHSAGHHMARKSDAETNLMVNYLPQDMGEVEFTNLFAAFGPLRKAKLVRNASTNMSLCYGFVDFQLVRNAQLAQMCLNGRDVRGKSIKVSYARPSSFIIKNAKVYVGNLPNHYDDEMVRQVFERCGKIEEIKVLRDRLTGVGRGTAFIRFQFRCSADLAVAVMDRHIPRDGVAPLQVRIAQRPNEFCDYSSLMARGWQHGKRKEIRRQHNGRTKSVNCKIQKYKKFVDESPTTEMPTFAVEPLQLLANRKLTMPSFKRLCNQED